MTSHIARCITDDHFDLATKTVVAFAHFKKNPVRDYFPPFPAADIGSADDRKHLTWSHVTGTERRTLLSRLNTGSGERWPARRSRHCGRSVGRDYTTFVHTLRVGASTKWTPVWRCSARSRRSNSLGEGSIARAIV